MKVSKPKHRIPKLSAEKMAERFVSWGKDTAQAKATIIANNTASLYWWAVSYIIAADGVNRKNRRATKQKEGAV